MIINAVVDNKLMRPHVGTEGSAGADLRIPYDIMIKPGEIVKVNTGVKVAIPEGYVGLIIPRSSLGEVTISLANTIGVIDSDYRGPLIIKLRNTGVKPALFYQYDRVVQLIIVPYLKPKFAYVKSLDITERGEGGFGSTGKQ